MFQSLNGGIRVRGAAGSLLWGYHEAATVGRWKIYKHENAWTLIARIVHVNAFQLRQRPLLFSAARVGGFWAWPVESTSLQVGTNNLLARLGPPEQ